MPRPSSPHAAWIAAAAIALALPPALRSAALAATAGTLFEATPFVLAAVAVPHHRLAGRVAFVFGLLGCGCGRVGLGALSLPAIGLCWLAFGPGIALARAAAALAVRSGFGRDRTNETAALDPLADLTRIAPTAFAAALITEGLRSTLPTHAVAPVAAALVGITLGVLLGMLAPCSTGSVAIAAGLRDVSPAACAAILATSGIVALPALSNRLRFGAIAMTAANPPARDARGAFAMLALGCAVLAIHGPSGFINPRFIVPIALAAIGAGILAVRGVPATRVRHAAAIPALLLIAYVAGSPVPDRVPLATTLDDPYPGEAVRFVGALVAKADSARIGAPDPRATLVRYTITCCRADAAARAVRLDRQLSGPAGGWYAASGTLALEGAGYVLHTASIRAIAPPADPFAYR